MLCYLYFLSDHYRDTFLKISPIYPNIMVEICNGAINTKNKQTNNSMAVPQKPKSRITIWSNAIFLCWLGFIVNVTKPRVTCGKRTSNEELPRSDALFVRNCLD